MLQVTLFESILGLKSYNIKKLFSTLNDPLLNPILLDDLSQDFIPILKKENNSGFSQKSYRLVVIFVLCER